MRRSGDGDEVAACELIGILMLIHPLNGLFVVTLLLAVLTLTRHSTVACTQAILVAKN
jgi:hypothetical protein